MILFYAIEKRDNSLILNESESQHCIKVLRNKIGDHIYITDTLGNLFLATITNDDSREVEAQIIEKKEVQLPQYRLHLAVAPTKNPDRMEWFIEKATEIGISEFTPIICKHSEKKQLNISRINRIVIAAAKQSLKFCFPVINEVASFDNVIRNTAYTNKYIATCVTEFNSKSLRDCYKKNSDAIILIGPEGDFSADEIKSAIQQGFEPINLGKNRYRTETAALISCAAIQFINE